MSCLRDQKAITRFISSSVQLFLLNRVQFYSLIELDTRQRIIQMTATNVTKSPDAKPTKTAINSTTAKTISKSAVAPPASSQRKSSPANTSPGVKESQICTPSPSDSGRQIQVNRQTDVVARASINSIESENDSSDDDDYTHQDSDAELGDDPRDDSQYISHKVIEEFYPKFIEKYSVSCNQAKILQEWRVFDKERGRRMAKIALDSLKSGIHSAWNEWSRNKEVKGRYVGVRDEYGNSFGQRPCWPGDLPEFRLENIRQEFVKWMKMFGWEVEDVTFDLIDGEERKEDTVSFWWTVTVPENWQNDN
jgi:hypothetical protein